MKHAVAVILASVCLLASVATQTAPNVTVAQGTLMGVTSTTLRGRMFYSYRGVPYAKPPVGERRFKAPEAVAPSNDLIDATRDGPLCTQKNYFAIPPTLSGVEDCLTLNVYTPNISPTLLPVMVYIHGGGFFAGSGASNFYGANLLMDKDVVLVTFNYRLGALGFLSTGDAAAPGNYGMKDQVLVLEWVRDNIAALGGDPGQVTIFGQSAGGACVHFHLFSDMSDGLFQRAISESGSALSAWAWPPEPLPMAQQQAAVFNCPQDDTTQLVACLRQVDAAILANSSDIFHFWGIDPITMYRPVVEAPWDGISEQPFLTGVPLELMRQGKFQKKPWMTGVVAQEGIIRGQPILSDEDDLREINSNWTTLGPRVFDLWSSNADAVQVAEIWTNATRFYFDDDLPVRADNGIHFIDMYSDRFFMHGIHKSALLQSQSGHNAIYLYKFNYQGNYSFGNYFAYNPINYGISHNDDLIYLFKRTSIPGFQEWPENHPDLKVVDSIVTLWTKFATFGSPTPSGSSTSVSCDIAASDSCDLSDLSWSPVPAGSTLCLHVFLNNSTTTSTLDFTMTADFFQERMAFWDAAALSENDAGKNAGRSSSPSVGVFVLILFALTFTS